MVKNEYFHSCKDFTTKTGKVFTFTSDIQRVCLDIEILEDEFVEGNETFTVVMLGFLVTLIPYRATVQIVDNDGQFYNTNILYSLKGGMARTAIDITLCNYHCTI